MTQTLMGKVRRPLPRGTLNYFGEVARSGSVRQAADRLYVAASAVSRQIAKLERSIGAPLFDRRADGMHLTKAGSLLAGYLNRNDRELEHALSSIDDLRGLKSGEVSITTVEGMIDEFLPRVITTFRNRYPGISLLVRVESALGVIEAVAADRTDIGIGFNVPSRKNLTVVTQHTQPIMAVCNPRHPLAKCKKISLKTLTEQALALQDTSFGIRRLVDDAFARARLVPQSFLVTNSLLMLKSLVKQDTVITLLPSYAVRAEVRRSELAALRIDSAILNSAHLDLCVHRSKQHSFAAEEFLALTKRELNTLR
jgi:DNA-binding transcriptional LysR family regulator